jgi:hypothetical protein
MRRSGPKIQGVLLAICYLEVLFWTACLLSSCVAGASRGEDTAYLARETGNLKQVVRPLEENQELFGAVDLRGAELDFQAERDCLQRLQEAQDPGRADFSLGSPLYLNLFPALQGSPAPYTGVKAIT